MYRSFAISLVFVFCQLGTGTFAQSDPIPPTIKFFSASHDVVAQYEQTAYFWKVSGDVASIDLYGSDCLVKPMNDRESYLSRPFSKIGVVPITLIVTGVDGSLVSETLLIEVTEPVHPREDPEIVYSELQIDSDRSGHISLSISSQKTDPISWQIGANQPMDLWFTPDSGTLERGNGTIDFNFESQYSLELEFITFELVLVRQGDPNAYCFLFTFAFDSQTTSPVVIPKRRFEPRD